MRIKQNIKVLERGAQLSLAKLPSTRGIDDESTRKEEDIHRHESITIQSIMLK